MGISPIGSVYASARRSSGPQRVCWLFKRYAVPGQAGWAKALVHSIPNRFIFL